MEQKHSVWTDLLIILGMVIFVFLLAQPFGRKWDEQTEDAYTGEEGVYALDMDTYYYLRKAREFTEDGISSIQLFSGRSNDQMMTPVRSNADSRDPQLMSAMAALLWFLLRAIGVHISIYTLCIHFSSFILGLCTIPTYLFLKKRVSRDAAVVGALFVALAPPFFKHSFCGVFDTDALICLLASIIVLSLYRCVLGKTRKEMLITGCFSIVATILLRLIWGSFYSYVVIAIGTAVVATAVTRILLMQKRHLLIPIIASCGMLMTLVPIMTQMVNRMKSMFGIIKAQEPWPQASANLVEMAKTRMFSDKGFWYWFMSVDSDFASYCGGVIVIGFVVLSGMICMIRFAKRRCGKETDNPDNDFLFVAVGCWLVGSVFLGLRAIRFMEFIVLPSAITISFGYFAIRNWLYQEKRAKTQRRAFYLLCAVAVYMVLVYGNAAVACGLAAAIMAYGFFGSRAKKDHVLLFVLAASILVSPLQNCYMYTSRTIPLMETPMEKSLLWIRDNSEKDAVIADFWSYGYIYQYYAERRTLADGGTYNGEYFYWLATMLMTDDANLSVGIIRMLQGSGLDATDYAVKMCGGNQKACNLLKEILPLSRTQARNILEGRYSAEQTETLLALSHPENCPEIYLVMNGNTFRSAAGLLYFSEWDFSGTMNAETVGQSTFLGQQAVSRPIEGEVVTCELWNKGESEKWNAKLYNEEGLIRGRLIDSEGKTVVASRTIYIKDGARQYEEWADSVLSDENIADQGALLILEESDKVSVVFCDAKLPDSVLYRLYLLDGVGQNVFGKVCEELLPIAVSGEDSVVQRRIGSQNMREYYNYGISVWKVQKEE